VLIFTWDEHKANLNNIKHGITFEEAKSVFYDDFARLLDDPDHSDTEERFLMLGLSFKTRLLIFCHCYRQNYTNIRIISARKATLKETDMYRRFRL
jgi:uncharacterized DUF497 family protein